MANPSRDKGTKWETDIVNWLLDNGYPDARRNVLGGRFDPSDIDPVPSNLPPILISAKFGYGGKPCLACHHAREVHAQTEQFRKWWFELQMTRRRRNVDALALLCLHRAGKASPQYAHWYVSATQLAGPNSIDLNHVGAVKITGEQALAVMTRFAPNPMGP